jgi:RimJ/RimL family protein N-acetyltransferase
MEFFFETNLSDPGRRIDLETLDATNPLLSRKYADAMQICGFAPCILGLEAEGKLVSACYGEIRHGRFVRSLAISSLPATSNLFWSGLLNACQKAKISCLEIESYGSAHTDIPSWPGEMNRRVRCEWIIDLPGRDLFSDLSAHHRRKVRQATREQVEIRRVRSHDAIQGHLSVIGASMARRQRRGERVPSEVDGTSIVAFLDMGLGELFQAVRNGKVCSSILVLRAPRGGYLQSAGSSPEGMKCGASHFLVHHICRMLQNDGAHAFNLGGALPHTSLGKYKARFGARPVLLEAASFWLGHPLKKKALTGLRMLRDEPIRLLKLLRPRLYRYVVYGAATDALETCPCPTGVEILRLADQQLTGLEDIPEELANEQIERFRYLGPGSYAFAVIVNGQVAHISWLLRATAELKVSGPLIALADDEAEITACYTLPEFRGKGFYPLAIRNIARMARDIGVSRVYMKTDIRNFPSQNGIERVGLRRLGQLAHVVLPIVNPAAGLTWRGHKRAQGLMRQAGMLAQVRSETKSSPI